jgi:putative nucleotidyltransferase with HDIG domain
MTLPITRDEAWQLVLKYNSEKSDLNHYLESEAVCRALAAKVGEDPEYFAIAGLIHDIDWGLTKENPTLHLTKAPDILREAGFDDKFIELILSHGYGFDCAGLLDKKRTRKEEFILAAGETITGLIHSLALMRPDKMEGMSAKSVKKKFKDKKFAAAISREVIREVEKMDLELNEFFEIAIRAIKKIKDEVGLG